MAETKHLNASIPAELYRKIRQAAAAEEKSITQFVIETMREKAENVLAFWLAGIKAEEEKSI